MTIDEAIDKMKYLKYKALQGAIIVHDTYSDDYELLDESALTALDMLIASLEAWEKVKADIIAESDNKSNNMQFNLGLLAALAIINGHFKEVGNGQTE